MTNITMTNKNKYRVKSSSFYTIYALGEEYTISI